jgi:hypothetical protein
VTCWNRSGQCLPKVCVPETADLIMGSIRAPAFWVGYLSACRESWKTVSISSSGRDVAFEVGSVDAPRPIVPGDVDCLIPYAPGQLHSLPEGFPPCHRCRILDWLSQPMAHFPRDDKTDSSHLASHAGSLDHIDDDGRYERKDCTRRKYLNPLDEIPVGRRRHH